MACNSFDVLLIRGETLKWQRLARVHWGLCKVYNFFTTVVGCRLQRFHTFKIYHYKNIIASVLFQGRNEGVF